MTDAPSFPGVLPEYKLQVKGFIHTPDNPAWSITEGEGGQVSLNMRGLPFPLTFDAEHWIAFKADVSSI